MIVKGKQSPLVSVVIPTYNQADFLRQAIQSVFDQSYSSWEIIIVDNESTDHTESVIRSFRSGKIKRLKIQNHGIIAASRNTGIRHARGKFIAFLDSDDYWFPEKLRSSIDQMTREKADAVCHSEYWLFENGQQKAVSYGPADRCTFRDLLKKGNCLSTSAILVKKEQVLEVGGFSENAAFKTVEDYDLWIRLVKHGCRFTFNNTLLGVYRIHSSGNSQSIAKHANATLALLHHYLSDGDTYFTERERRMIFFKVYRSTAFRFLKQMQLPKLAYWALCGAWFFLTGKSL